MRFERAVATHKLIDEMMPLLEKHRQEIAIFQDIKLKPASDKYVAMENSGVLRVFTARDVQDALVGYAVYFVNHNMHYADSLQAVQDVLYLEPSKRGLGLGQSFIDWCDMQLKMEGIQVVYQHVKIKFNFGPMLEGLGYEHVEHIYARRLDV